MKTYKRYPPEIRERAVRLVLEHQEHYRSEWAALTAITEDHVSHSTVILFDHRAQFPLWNQPYRSGKGFFEPFSGLPEHHEVMVTNRVEQIGVDQGRLPDFRCNWLLSLLRRFLVFLDD